MRPLRMLVLVVGLFAATLGLAGAAQARLAPDPLLPDTVPARGTDERRTFFPTITRLRDGRLATVYYDSPEHLYAAGRVSMVTSSDRGRTWSAPTVVLDTPYDERDPSITQTRSGALLLTWFAIDWSTSELLGTFVSRSTDGGRTWSAPIEVHTKLSGAYTVPNDGYAHAWAATSAKPIQLRNGDLLIPIYGTLPDNTFERVTVVRSTDDGRTWSAARESEVAVVPGVHLTEPAIAQLGTGRIIAIIRSDAPPSPNYFTYSDDGGRTWAQVEQTNMHLHAPDLMPISGHGGKLVLLTGGDISGQSGPADQRVPVGRVLEAGRPLDAHPLRLLYQSPVPGWDMSYPSSAEVGHDRFLTVFYDVNPWDRRLDLIGGRFSTLRDYLP